MVEMLPEERTIYRFYAKGDLSEKDDSILTNR